MSPNENLTDRQASWLTKIIDSPGNSDRPAYRKIYQLMVNGTEYTFATSKHYLVAMAGHSDLSEIPPANIAVKVLDYLRDKRTGFTVTARVLRTWAGPPDWDNKHLGCSICNGRPISECSYCSKGKMKRACHYCGETHACRCKECDGRGSLRCAKIRQMGWLNNIMLSRQAVAQSIYGITTGNITILDTARDAAVYFDAANLRAVVIPLNQDQVTEEEIKTADRLQFGKREK